jgi:predicted RNA-binding protein
VGEGTTFDETGTLLSLEAMAGALDAGDVVTVIGQAEKNGETGAWDVLTVKADTNAGPGEFEGKVVSVDLEAGTFTLANKRVYTVGEETVFDEAGDLLSLEAMAGALDAGDNVTVLGQATKDELGAWLVSTVLVEVNGEDGEFEGRVDSIDLENGTFTLKNKRTYTVGEGTTFDETGTLLSLEAMAGALDAGDKVKVMGQATKDELGAWLVATVRAEVNGG